MVAKLKEKYGEAPATVSVREAREAELRDFYSRVDPTKAAAVASLLEGNTFPELLSYLMDRYGAAPDGWARAVAEAEMKASGKKGRSQRSKAKARSKPRSTKRPEPAAAVTVVDQAQTQQVTTQQQPKPAQSDEQHPGSTPTALPVPPAQVREGQPKEARQAPQPPPLADANRESVTLERRPSLLDRMEKAGAERQQRETDAAVGGPAAGGGLLGKLTSGLGGLGGLAASAAPSQLKSGLSNWWGGGGGNSAAETSGDKGDGNSGGVDEGMARDDDAEEEPPSPGWRAAAWSNAGATGRKKSLAAMAQEYKT